MSMHYLKVTLSTLGLLFVFRLSAQLSPSFVTDKIAGCSPLTITFTNTTTGVTGSAKYDWDFGNTNTASNTDKSAVAATYLAEGTFTVKLTVTNNGAVKNTTQTITIYKKPIASFTLNKSGGCTPLKVDFTSTSTSTDGFIISYNWDFGNGKVDSNSNTQNTYNSAGAFAVQLVVKSSVGCASAPLSVPNAVTTLPSPIASFAKDKRFLCQVGETVAFTNLTTNTSSTTYKWDFGDGNTSTANSPTYNYTTKGIFPIKLIATNGNFCADTFVSTQPLYSAIFNSSITNTKLCVNTNVQFFNSTQPTPDSCNWLFNNSTLVDTNSNVIRQFNASGSYSVQLINFFGTCSDTVVKNFTVPVVTKVTGFDINITPFCSGVSTLILTDTTAGSTAWVWNIIGMQDSIITKTATYSFKNDSIFQMNLTVSDSLGCKDSVTKSIVVNKLTIIPKTNNLFDTSLGSGCTGINVKFSVQPALKLKSFFWEFGDGATSISQTPNHDYLKVGQYRVKLTYTTLTGCVDSIFYSYINVYDKPKADFVTSSNSVCGSNRVYFFDRSLPAATGWAWDFGDNSNINNDQNPYHKYFDSGYFNVKLIVYNGTCFDSITKQKILYINPPFPRVDSVVNTCAGNRDLVGFRHQSKLTDSLWLNFGDGTSSIIVDTGNHTFLYHTYAKTGSYLSTLTGKRGACVSIDSFMVFILTPQHPILSANKTDICVSDSLRIFIDKASLAVNPSSGDSNYYSLYNWAYNDNSIFTGSVTTPPNWYYSTQGQGVLNGFAQGKTSLFVITQSAYFGCFDSSNTINLKVKGPVAKYSIIDSNNCFRLPITFQDNSSTNFGVPIVRWIWRYGDRTFDTAIVGGTIKHIYANPRKYVSSLLVIDQDGCYNVFDNPDTIRTSGPQAAFTYTPPYVTINTAVSFLNTSNLFRARNTNFIWKSTNGLSTNTLNAGRTYSLPLIDTVTLFGKDARTGCSDSVTQYIIIKKVYAIFDYKEVYRGKGGICPPLDVQFASHSLNADKLLWDFGDNTPGTGLTKDSTPSHRYSLPGIYTIKLYAYNSFSSLPQDSTFTVIKVDGPTAFVKSNITQGCAPLTVVISASKQNAIGYKWDFGDGTVINNPADTFQAHTYTSAGLINPIIIVTDAKGCEIGVALPSKILVDSIKASFIAVNSLVCDSAVVNFYPNTSSFSGDSLKMPLINHWSFGTGEPADTSNLAIPSFYYNYLGNYPVKQHVVSQIGCISDFVDTIYVKQSSRGVISGPIKACENDTIQFQATAPILQEVTWNWAFPNGTFSSIQNPNGVAFYTGKDTVKIDSVRLITKLNNCFDTTYKKLVVYPKPRTNLLPQGTSICYGTSLKLAAHDGVKFEWAPVFINTADSIPTVKPRDTVVYHVKVTNQYGCFESDSTQVNVIPHFKLLYPIDTFVCAGRSIVLPVSGPDKVDWLGDSATLSLFGFSPTATPVNYQTTYTLVATDKYGCFSDTAKINLTAQQFPTVSVKKNLFNLSTGSQVQLSALTSADVNAIQWSPIDYLSCTTCSNPVSTPRSEIVYTVSASNKYGCKVADKVTIKLNCLQEMYLPTAFVPEGNSKNRLFLPLGRGVKQLVYFRVFNRSGQKIFERTNVPFGDRSQAWDGTLNGKPVQSGTYVYTIQAQCDTGEYFERNGTVVLIR